MSLIVYSFDSFYDRNVLSVLHFNENVSREQKRSANDELQWTASYPKYLKGKGILRPVRVPCTYGKSTRYNIKLTLNPLKAAKCVIA